MNINSKNKGDKFNPTTKGDAILVNPVIPPKPPKKTTKTTKAPNIFPEK